MLKIRHAITASKNAFLAYVDEILPQKKEPENLMYNFLSFDETLDCFGVVNHFLNYSILNYSYISGSWSLFADDAAIIFFNVIFYYSFPCCFARLLLIAAMTFAEFYIPFVELSKIALLFVVFRSLVWTKFTFCRFLLRTPWVLVLFLERSHQADITSTHPLNWRQIKHFIALSQLFLPKKSLVSKFFVNLYS